MGVSMLCGPATAQDMVHRPSLVPPSFEGGRITAGCERGSGGMRDMYAISEMARMFGVSRQTLIYYDRIGLFRPAHVNDEGYRLYAPTQIPQLRLICLLRSMGLELKEIERVLATPDPARIAECLVDQVADLDSQIAQLQARRAAIQERLEFYEDVSGWKDQMDRPVLRHYPERKVVFEPYPADAQIGRAVLHPALMRLVSRLRDEASAAPVRGWGTMLRRAAFADTDLLRGSGPFVVVPEGADLESLGGVQTLPAGIYLCLARWGMPYDTRGIRRLIAWMREHRLHATGDAFDFCLMDATCYDDDHQEDFCCLQVPVEMEA